MSVNIYLETKIKAPIQRVFDAARSIDLHLASFSHTNETAIAGKTSGLIGLDETVTWEATHFGCKQQLTSKVTQFKSPYLFTDEMVKGAFKNFKHIHFFDNNNGVTTMYDVFIFESPFGIFGQVANVLFLKKYMKNLLTKRNQDIKKTCEKKLP